MRAALYTAVACAALAGADGIYRDAGASAFQFLKIEVSARAAALGGTVLMNSGPLSGLSCPARLMDEGGPTLTAGHAMYFGSTVQNFAAFTGGSGRLRFSAAVNALSASNLEYRGDEPTVEPLGTFDYLDMAASGAVAMRFGPVDAGVGLKLLREKIWDVDDWGVAVDASILAHPADWLDAGAAVLNLGPSVDFGSRPGYRMPMTWRVGASATAGVPLLGETSITAEMCKPIDNRISGGMGLEMSPCRWLALRAGSKVGSDSNDLTAGVGLSAGGWSLDYAWIPGALSLGDIHRIVLSTGL